MFQGPFTLSVRSACDRCGLDYTFADAGDGPAIFAIFILGVLMLGGALIAEFKFGLPAWAHVLLWGLLTPVAAVVLLRTLKSKLIACNGSTQPVNAASTRVEALVLVASDAHVAAKQACGVTWQSEGPRIMRQQL